MSPCRAAASWRSDARNLLLLQLPHAEGSACLESDSPLSQVSEAAITQAGQAQLRSLPLTGGPCTLARVDDSFSPPSAGNLPGRFLWYFKT